MIQRLIIILTMAGWLVVVILVAQINLIGFKTATLRWPNVTQPNTIFHWAGNISKRGIIPADTEAVVYITVPRQFNTATLNVFAQRNGGQLQVKVDSIGANNTQVIGPAGTAISLPLIWSQLATKSKSFNVRIRAINETASITGISLIIRQ